VIKFTLPLEAIPVQTGGKRLMIRGGRPLFFKDKRTERYMKAIAAFAARHVPPAPLEGSLEIGLIFVMGRPKRLMRKADPEDRIWCPVRPDWDNLCKGVCDGLQGFWLDDAQIVRADVEKLYAAKGENPKIHVTIRPINESETC
jgi:Holliday junction resolvase RusA-like endonuclease